MTTTTVKNGIDVGQLMATIDAIRNDGDLSGLKFRTTTT